MSVLSQAISGFSLVLGILLTSCRPGPPSTVTPENLSFRSYRLADARPAGFGYSVISDKGTWEQFLRDRTPSASRPSPETSQIDFKTRSLVILHAGSGSQCLDEVVQRVTRQADTIRVLLGSLMGPCPMSDAWIEVIELPRFRGPVRIDYPLDEYRPLWIEREIPIPPDPKDAGFVAAPDSVPSWLLADSSFADPTPYTGLKFARNIVRLQFRPEGSPAERRSAIGAVSGRVVGGYRVTGTFLVQVMDPGDGSGIERAAARLRALPFVAVAGPFFGPDN